MRTETKSRKVGPDQEIFVYKFKEKIGRAWKRTLVRNTTVTDNLHHLMYGLPRGWYRLEWRDAHRWVTHVVTCVLDEQGPHLLPPQKKRSGPRKVPPPIVLPPPQPRPAQPPAKSPPRATRAASASPTNSRRNPSAAPHDPTTQGHAPTRPTHIVVPPGYYDAHSPYGPPRGDR